jgi:hypothetical protein
MHTDEKNERINVHEAKSQLFRVKHSNGITLLLLLFILKGP